MSRTVAHEPSEACDQTHCHGCGLDHTGPAWRWCFECGHAYRTPGELRRAYRRAVWELTVELLPYRPWLRSNAWYPSVVAQMWRILTARASRITFCQLCLHDF